MKTARWFLVGLVLLAACTSARTTIGPAATASPVMVVPADAPVGSRGADRSLLTSDLLMYGFEAASPIDESAMAMPAGAAPAAHTFEGRLELVGEREGDQIQMLRGDLGARVCLPARVRF